jgi:rhodanese-related sulfurtransferase
MIILFVAFALAATAAARLQVDATVYDFGTVVHGYSYSHGFAVTNTGTAPLTVSRVSPLCACTTAVGPPSAILPGETAELLVVLDTSKLNAGTQLKRIIVNSNDPSNGALYLEIMANVVREPQSYHLSTGALDAAYQVLLDVRSRDAFATGHLYGALNVPAAELGAWAGNLPRGTRLVLCDAEGGTALASATTLDRAGFDALALEGGLVAWQSAYGGRYLTGTISGTVSAPTGSSPLEITAQALRNRYYVLVDLRSAESYQASHLIGAVHVPDEELLTWVAADGLPTETPLILYADDSHASDLAAQALRARGYAATRSLLGGLDEWIDEVESRSTPERSRLLSGPI